MESQTSSKLMRSRLEVVQVVEKQLKDLFDYIEVEGTSVANVEFITLKVELNMVG